MNENGVTTVFLKIVVATADNTGVESVIYNLATSLLRGGYPVVFSVVVFKEGNLVDKLRAAGVDTHVIKIKGKFDFFGLYKLTKFLSRQTTIVHSHGSRASFYCSIASLFSRFLHVVTIHQNINARDHNLINVVVVYIEKLLMSLFVDHRVYVSNSLRNNIEPSLNIKSSSSSCVIYNSLGYQYSELNLLSIDNLRMKIRRERCYGNQFIIIGCIGRLIGIKGQRLLIESFRLLKDTQEPVKLVFIGDGPDKNNLANLVHSLGLIDSVHFLGNVNDCREWYASLDLLVIPSLTESFGLVAIEGANFNLEIVASDCDGLHETLSGYPYVTFCDVNNSALLAKAISLALIKRNVRPERDLPVTNAFIYKYRIDHFGLKHIQMYNSLIC